MKKSILSATLAFAALGLWVEAQQYSIDWHKISGGGGTSTNGQYSVSGTIGQHDDAAGGAMTGGNYSVTGGFWALISVVQSLGAPTLYITHTGNSVTLFWQNTSTWTLQQNSNLADASGWTSSSYSIATANGTNSITINNPTSNLFFRLKQ
jgi:hypothetical protein